MPKLASHPDRRRLPQLLTATALLALVFTTTALPVAAASAQIKFGVHIGSQGGCVTVLSGADNKTITVTWRDAQGDLKGQATQTSPDIFYFCSTNLAIEIGDRLTATDGTYTRHFTVPNLTINLNRVTDIYYGTGPANRTIHLELVNGDVGRTKLVRVGDDGTWSFHSDYWDIYGGDGAGLSWKSPNDDRVFTEGIASFLVVTLDKAGFSGWAVPGQNVDVALDGPVDADGSAIASASGDFAGKFRDGTHNLRPAAAGDHLTTPSLATDADWIVPEIDGSANAETDRVDGRCHDNGTFGGVVVRLYRTGLQRGLVYLGYNAGPFSFNFLKVGDFFANAANVKHGDQIVIQCVQESGDIAQLKFIVP